MKWILLHVAIWLVFFVTIVFYKAENLGFDYAIEHTVVAGTINIVFFYLYAIFAVERYLEKKKYGLFSICALGLLIVFYFFKVTVEIPNYQAFYDLNSFNDPVREKVIVLGTLLTLMMMSTILTVLRNSIDKQNNAQQLINEHNEAKLSYLKAQINPHFLFNSLNNIYSLSVVKSNKTPKMVTELADLLRYSIYEGEKEKVYLSDEVEHIKKYLNLFQIAKEEPAAITFEIKGEMAQRKIEPMILLPLVENCVKHGDFDSNPHAFVHITLVIERNKICFKTVNTKNDLNQQKDGVGGVGLANIKKRLQLKYPEHHTFKILESGEKFSVAVALFEKYNG